MHFFAEGTLILLETVTVLGGLFIAYILGIRQQSGVRGAARAASYQPGIAFFILIALSIGAAHTLVRWGHLPAALLSLALLWPLAAAHYFSNVRAGWNDERIRSTVLITTLLGLVTFIALFLLWWGGERFKFEDEFRIDSAVMAQFVNNLLQIIGIIIAAAMIVVTNRMNAQQANETSRQQIYQTLELQSIELFRYETTNPELFALLWHPEKVTASGDETPATPEQERQHNIRIYQLRQYVCQMLNLFEMAVRFRLDGIVLPDIFGSWVIWMWELCLEEVFQQHWDNGTHGLRFNYIPDFRRLMDKGVELARAKGDDGIEEFFSYVSTDVLGGCDAVLNWMKDRRAAMQEAA